MGAPIRRLRHFISLWPFFRCLGDREPVLEQPEIPDEVPFRFKECGADCGPSAREIEAKEHERAERFKRDQLLPIMGLGGGSPSPPS